MPAIFLTLCAVFAPARRVLPLLAVVLALFLPAVAARAESPTEVRIGLLAKRGSATDLALWQPTADYLSARLPDHRFRIVALDFTEIHDSVRAGRIDFVLANSAFYVELERLHGANRITTLINRSLPGQSTTTFGGVIFCRADRSDLRSLADLRDQRFMAGAAQVLQLEGEAAGLAHAGNAGRGYREDLGIGDAGHGLGDAHAHLLCAGLAQRPVLQADVGLCRVLRAVAATTTGAGFP